MTTIHLLITPGVAGAPPTVLARAVAQGGASLDTAAELTDPGSDTALVARAMLQAGAYLFASGQPVRFGAEIPKELLK